MNDKINDRTMDKTLWSETLIDMLIIALVAKKPDDKIKELIRECRQKGFKKNYLVRKIKKEVDEKAAVRISKLLS